MKTLFVNAYVVTMDDDRANRALALLKRVADDFQIIYLTTSDRYDAAAHAVVELPGPAAVDEVRAAEALIVWQDLLIRACVSKSGQIRKIALGGLSRSS